MKIMYKCTCMPAEREIDVTERPPGSDLIMWVECVVGGTISLDHQARNPACRNNIMEYVKIPVDENAEGIGEKPRLSS